MCLEDLIREVSYAVPDDLLRNDLKPVVNRAIRAIAQRGDWTCTHSRRAVVLPSGATSTPLSALYKKLTSEITPITLAYGQYNLPVRVVSREQVEAWGTWPWPMDNLTNVPLPGVTCPLRVVFLEQNGPGGPWAIHIPPQFPSAVELTFHISAYWYPEDLRAGQDSNNLTNHPDLGDAITNLAKSMLYAMNLRDKVNVAAFQAARTIYEQNIKSAFYSDAAIWRSGRLMRM